MDQIKLNCAEIPEEPPYQKINIKLIQCAIIFISQKSIQKGRGVSQWRKQEYESGSKLQFQTFPTIYD